MLPNVSDSVSQQKLLLSTLDWFDWRSVTKSYAENWGVWSLVNPDGTEEPTLQTEPAYPEPHMIDKEAESLLDLNEADLNRWNLLIKDYDRRLKIYEKQQIGLEELRMHLHATVRTESLTPMVNKTPILCLWGIMKGLKMEFCPSTEERLEEVVNRLSALKRFLKGENLCKWVKKWQQIKPPLEEAGATGLNTLRQVFLSVNAMLTHTIPQRTRTVLRTTN